MTPSQQPPTPPYRAVVEVPIAIWWLGLAALVIFGSLLFVGAWFVSGLLMLINCVLCDEMDRAYDLAAPLSDDNAQEQRR